MMKSAGIAALLVMAALPAFARDVNLSNGDRAPQVVPVGPNGAAVGSSTNPTVTREQQPSTTTVTTKASATTNVLLLAANPNRLRYALYNASTSVMYVLDNGGVASSTNYTTQIAAGGFYSTNSYIGAVNATWATANGGVQVTEYTP